MARPARPPAPPRPEQPKILIPAPPHLATRAAAPPPPPQRPEQHMPRPDRQMVTKVATQLKEDAAATPPTTLETDTQSKKAQKDIDTFVLKCMTDFKYFSAACLKIKTKTDGIKPLEFNHAQLYMNAVVDKMINRYGMVRIVIVKGRQQGLSTWVEGRGYWKTIHNSGTNAYILAHESDATKNLFNMAKRYHEHCPAELKPLTKKSNAKELIFHELESEYAVGTAKTGDTGRGQTLHFFHGCLAEHTRVRRASGELDEMYNFKIGDRVITHTGATAPVSFISVQKKFVFRMVYVLNGGRKAAVSATLEHRFRACKSGNVEEWVTLDRIKQWLDDVEDVILCDGLGSGGVVESVEPLAVRVVRDFEIDHPDHSFQLEHIASHNSECAYWNSADEIASGAMQGIPEAAGTEVYMESTAAGAGGFFHSLWQNACHPDDEPGAHWNGYWQVFIPWFWEPGYRRDVGSNAELGEDELQMMKLYGLDRKQLSWRRHKIATFKGDVSRFERDYPCTPAEAFNSNLTNVLVSPATVLMAMQAGRDEVYAAVGRSVLGVDVAREGDDDSVLVLRQGRVMPWYKKLSKLKTIEVAGQVVMAIKTYQVAHVCIDITGGYGAGVYDVLVGWGYGDMVSGIGFQEKAIEDERYRNRRSEMYWHLKEWLEQGASIPNHNEWLTELCAITYKHDPTNDKLQLERKDEIKKRIGKSTDIGDAAALTFCMPAVTMDGSAGSFNPFDEFGVI